MASIKEHARQTHKYVGLRVLGTYGCIEQTQRSSSPVTAQMSNAVSTGVSNLAKEAHVSRGFGDKPIW